MLITGESISAAKKDPRKKAFFGGREHYFAEATPRQTPSRGKSACYQDESDDKLSMIHATITCRLRGCILSMTQNSNDRLP
jgi:hypothetical protein